MGEEVKKIGIPYFPATANGHVCPVCLRVVKNPGEHWVEAQHQDNEATKERTDAAFALAATPTVTQVKESKGVSTAVTPSIIGAKVFVVTITHKHGTNSEVYATRESADASVFDFVTEYWSADGPEGGDAEMPEDPAARIDQYFHHDNQMESYSIEECEVQA